MIVRKINIEHKIRKPEVKYSQNLIEEIRQAMQKATHFKMRLRLQGREREHQTAY